MLNIEEEIVVEKWKTEGVIQKLTPEHLDYLLGVTSAVDVCADGRGDACCFLRHKVGCSENDRNGWYSGPAIFAESFGRFEEAGALFLRDLMFEGLELRGITDLIEVFHWPCGMLKKYGHTLTDVPTIAREAEKFLLKGLPPGINLHMHFHVRRLCSKCQVQLQETYLFAPVA